MPTRSRNARHRKRVAPAYTSDSEASTPLDSPALSPPTHLPTPDDHDDNNHERHHGHIPLPPAEDLQGTIPDLMAQSTDLPHLIDFDDHHPAQPLDPTMLFDHEDTDPGVYRSPPFMEAQLPPAEEADVQAPLMIPPPRTLREDEWASGHVAAPMLPRRSTSRTPSSPPYSPPPSSTSFATTTTSSPYPSYTYSPSSQALHLPGSTPNTSPGPAGNALDSISRTIRSYSPFPNAVAMTPYPPAAPRAVVEPESRPYEGEPGGETRERGGRREQEFEREYEREYEDGYGGAGRMGLPIPSVPSSSSSSANYVYPNLVPDRQRAWHDEHERERDSPVAAARQHRSRGSVGGGTLSGGSGSGNGGSGSGGGAIPMRRGSSPLRPRREPGGVERGGSGGGAVEYPRNARGEDVDRVVWARWDRLGMRPLLILGYPTGIQIWETSNLASVTEVLNLNVASSLVGVASGGEGGDEESEGTGTGKVVAVVKAGIIPSSSSSSMGVGVGEEGVLGILLESQAQQYQQQPRPSASTTTTTLVVYSLKRDVVLEKCVFPGVPQGFEVGRGGESGFMVVSTSLPAALHIISTISFKTLYTIPASSLATFAVAAPSTNYSHQVPHYISSTSNVQQQQQQQHYYSQSLVSPASADGLYSLEEGGGVGEAAAGAYSHHRYRGELAHPVFALENRLLAYAVPSSASSTTPSSFSSGLLRRKPSSSSSSSTHSHSPSSYTSPHGIPGGGPSSSSSPPGSSPSSHHSHSHSPSSTSSPFPKIPALPRTQQELGSAALKVGGSVMSGMKFLGGIALEAAKNRMSGGGSGASGPITASPMVYQRSAGGYAEDGGSTAAAAAATAMGGGMRAFFSRSAPSGSAGVGEAQGAGGLVEEQKRRRFSGVGGDPNATIQDLRSQQGVSPSTMMMMGRGKEKGFVVVVVDLEGLVESSRSPPPRGRLVEKGGGEGNGGGGRGRGEPRVVAEFVGSKSQPIANLAFSPDGCLVLVVPRDGYVTKVFQLRPAPSLPAPTPDLLSPNPSSNTAVNTSGLGAAQQQQVAASVVVPLYELRRGWTTALVEEVGVVGDARWMGVATRNRTVHVFATNMGGGKPHVASHLEGRVRNGGGESVLPQHQPKIKLDPIVRLHGLKLSASEEERGPPPSLSFTFVDPSEISLPLSLNPPSRVHTSSDATSTVTPASSSPPPLSPLRVQYASPKNHQDILVFDCATGILALHRIIVEQKQKDYSVGLGGIAMSASVSASAAAAFLSGSLPGMGAGPLSASSSLSSNSNAGQGKVSGVSVSSGGRYSASGGGHGVGAGGAVRVPEDVYELVGKASVSATWNLQRKKNWVEVRGMLGVQGREAKGERETVVGSEECLAQAELSTFSKSRTALTRPIYLSHQFSFQTLGEDYHALIRKYRLDVDGAKIDVRKDVPIQAFTSTSSSSRVDVTSESFVEGFSPPHQHRTRHHHTVSSSFDEPLASALAGELDYQPPAAVLPMYPNGVPTRSFRNSIPIRAVTGLGDGVSEGLGKIRREMMQARLRSPRLGPRVEGESGNSTYGDVLLEFDEEVDDFMAPRFVDGAGEGGGVGAGSGGAGASRGLGFDDDIVGKVDEEIWDGWDNQDKMAVEEAEQFHTISTAQYAVDDAAAPVGASKAGNGTAATAKAVPVVGQPKKLSKKRK